MGQKEEIYKQASVVLFASDGLISGLLTIPPHEEFYATHAAGVSDLYAALASYEFQLRERIDNSTVNRARRANSHAATAAGLATESWIDWVLDQAFRTLAVIAGCVDPASHYAWLGKMAKDRETQSGKIVIALPPRPCISPDRVAACFEKIVGAVSPLVIDRRLVEVQLGKELGRMVAIPNLEQRINVSGGVVTLDGHPHRVTPDAESLFRALVEAKGDRVAASKYNSKPARLYDGLPCELKNVIDRNNNGYRLTI